MFFVCDCFIYSDKFLDLSPLDSTCQYRIMKKIKRKNTKNDGMRHRFTLYNITDYLVFAKLCQNTAG